MVLLGHRLALNIQTGQVIELIKNDSFFEVGGWGDGQSPGDSYLDGFIKQVNISFSDNRYSYQFIEENRDKDYFCIPTYY
jgi:hypothetical protein